MSPRLTEYATFNAGCFMTAGQPTTTDAWFALATAVEETTGVRDDVFEELTASELDADHALERALNQAAEAFRSEPPDFNESVNGKQYVAIAAGNALFAYALP